VLSLGFFNDKGGVGWLLLFWKACCSQGNRTGQMAMKNKPPIFSNSEIDMTYKLTSFEELW